jgi:hypothetical protein
MDPDHRDASQPPLSPKEVERAERLVRQRRELLQKRTNRKRSADAEHLRCYIAGVALRESSAGGWGGADLQMWLDEQVHDARERARFGLGPTPGERGSGVQRPDEFPSLEWIAGRTLRDSHTDGWDHPELKEWLDRHIRDEASREKFGLVPLYLMTASGR